MPVPFARSASQTRPTFSRDFAGLKTLDHGAGPAIAFTRASNATYFNAAGTLTTATTNEPRFDHDPATGASRGLLIEEARTNLLVRSAEFDNASWTKTGGTITANADTAPDGTTTADKFVESNANETHQVFQTVAGVAAIQTASFFVKAAGRTSCQFLAFNATDGAVGRANVDLTNGVTSSVIGTATSTSVGNGWYRIAVTYTPTVTNTSFNLFPREGGSTSYAGNGTDGILIWGAQLEVGAFPTSYIPTTTAAATRSADSAVVTPISSFYNQSEGTLFAEATSSVPPATTAVFHIDNDSNNERLLVGRGSGASLTYAAVTTGGSLVAGQTTALSAGTERVALAYATDNVAFRTSSLTLQEDSSASVPVSLTHARIGRNGAGAFHTGHIRKIAYYPRRLSNTLLQQLTT